jgi:hypothetical protein
MSSDKIIKDQINTYLDNFKKNKDSSLGTFQNDRVTQYMRFEHIIKEFKPILNETITFHDFGCGCCDMYEYLLQNNIKVKYSGTEIIQEMIDHAREKFPGIELYNRDVLKEPVNDKYHIVVFSGGLYLPGNIPHDEWKKFVFDIISKMWEMSTVGISFNLLTTYSTYKSDHLFYVSPAEIIDYCCQNLSRFVNLDQSYPLYEWTITVFKKEYIQEKYKQPELQKYLK